MPSKYSENLKQAIQYIKAGEMEIAREIILEIIQNDPDYEKAWIWLVETVAEKDGKVDILKTRLEQYPNSPLARKALEHIAPEVLNHLHTGEDAIFIPPSARSAAPESEEDQTIEYDVTSRDTGGNRFGFDGSDLIDFDEIKKESGELFTGEELFGSDDNDINSDFASLLEDEEEEDADEVLEQDLEAFLRGSVDLDEPAAKGTQKPASSDEMTFTDWLKGEDDESDEEDAKVDELAYLMAQDSSQMKNQDDTSASNPFVLSREESLELFGEDVLNNEEEEEQDAVAALRAKTGISKPGVFSEEGIEAFDLEDDLFPELQAVPGEVPVSEHDMVELENGLRKEVLGSNSHPQSATLQNKATAPAKKKKAGNKNQAFIWGCSVLAAIIIISLLGMAWLFFENMRNAPPTPTATLEPSATPTEVYTLVAPWLAEETPTPEGN